MRITDDNIDGLFDWFSSPKTYTKEQNLAAGRAWLQSVYNALKPNATSTAFFNALRMDSYDSKIPEEDFISWMTTVGANVNTSAALMDKVKASLLKSFTSKTMLPTRKSIDSAMLNPDVVKWTYWDAAKVVAKDTASTVTTAAQNVAAVASTATGAVSLIVKYRVPIILLSLAGIGYFIYQNRGEVSARIKEKAFKKIGLS